MKPLTINNPTDFGKVAVLMGGSSAEREISLNSGNAVYLALKAQGVEVIALDISDNPIQDLAGLKLDRVINLVHGRGGEDGVLQAILEALKIPYTGSGVLASALSMDKLRTKLCWQGMGLSTPKWFVLQTQQDIEPCIAELGFPVIVKPAQEGSSIGMSKANTQAELLDAFHLARQYQCDVYAEQWVQGNEYTVGVLNGEALPAIRLQTPNAFYDFEAKYRANTTQYHCPAGLSHEREAGLHTLAIKACKGLNVKGWARVDVFIDHNDCSQLIEVNTVPGMTDHSLVPMAAKAAGIDFNELTWRILETSLTNRGA